MSKFKPQLPGSRPGCNRHGEKRHSKHRDYSLSSESSDGMYAVKHEAHCPLYSPSIPSSDSETSTMSFEQEYYQLMKHKRDPRSKNRPRHRSTSPKGMPSQGRKLNPPRINVNYQEDCPIHRRQPPKNTSRVERKARSSTAKPTARPDKHSKSSQQRGNFSTRSSSSGTSTSSSSSSQHSFSNFKQSPRRGHKGRSPSSSSSESSQDSSCPNCKHSGKGRRSSHPRNLTPQRRNNIPMGPPTSPIMIFEHNKDCPYRYDSRKNSKSGRNFMPAILIQSAGKPRKSSRRRSSSSSSSSGFEQDYRQKHVKKSSKPKSHPQQHKKKKSKSRPRAK
ncbi:unnamed protein product [Rodentolepis nana]|uniref:SRRM_C domain-containing protein n=1 Tax=Rodentolepis nana TaxID=102285 RepID=A0A0R3T817_RODNA|nr:unnamed protein product [Rodentolepis nana]